MSWVPVTTPPSIGGQQLASLAFDATSGRWCIADNLNRTWTSDDDGATWAGPFTVDAAMTGVYGLGFAAGLFIAFGPVSGGGINIYSSPDGQVWTNRAASVDSGNFVATPGCIAYNGLWCIAGASINPGGNSSVTSPDGITWTPHTALGLQLPDGFSALASDGTHFVAEITDSSQSPSAQLGVSTDGSGWTEQAFNTLPGPDGVFFGILPFLGKYIASGGLDNATPQGWLEVGTDLAVWDGAQVDVNTTPAGGFPIGPFAASGTECLGVVQMPSGQNLVYVTTDGTTYNTFEDPGYGATGFVAGITRGADGFMAFGEDSSSAPLVAFRADATTVAVPDLTGLNATDAGNALTTADLVQGPVLSQFNSLVAAGLVFAQTIAAGTVVPTGTAVGFTVSLGPPTIAVPDVVGLTAAQAEAAIAVAGLITGDISGVTGMPAIPVGSVATQSPAAGTQVVVGSAVDIGISFVSPPFDIDVTLIAQYANSPILVQLVEDFGQWFDPTANIQEFYLQVWNIDTAEGFGLDIWGRILGVSRIVPIPGTSGVFGFETADVPPDWQNFGNLAGTSGGPFSSGTVIGSSFKLDDAPYRTLLLTKALANICTTTAPGLNALITNLFPGRGRCYTIDRGAMQMSYVFEFTLSPVEFAILAFSGVLAHPAGVGFNIVVVEGGDFGFNEAQSGDLVQPFDNGPFYNGG